MISIYSPDKTNNIVGSLKFGSYDPIAVKDSFNIIETLTPQTWQMNVANAKING